jgi:hypothetical protein
MDLQLFFMYSSKIRIVVDCSILAKAMDEVSVSLASTYQFCERPLFNYKIDDLHEERLFVLD